MLASAVNSCGDSVSWSTGGYAVLAGLPTDSMETMLCLGSRAWIPGAIRGESQARQRLEHRKSKWEGEIDGLDRPLFVISGRFGFEISS